MSASIPLLVEYTVIGTGPSRWFDAKGAAKNQSSDAKSARKRDPSFVPVATTVHPGGAWTSMVPRARASTRRGYQEYVFASANA